MCSCMRITTSVRSSPPRALYFCVRLYSANPQGLPIVLLVLAPQGFELLCTCVRCESQRPLCGASLQRLYTVCARACASVYCTDPKSFARCEPTKALCFCVPYECQELCAVRAYKGFVPLCAVRAPRAFFGASLQRFYTMCARARASVYCTSLTSFVRCEPTKALYSVLVLAPQALHRVLTCSCGRMSR